MHNTLLVNITECLQNRVNDPNRGRLGHRDARLLPDDAAQSLALGVRENEDNLELCLVDLNQIAVALRVPQIPMNLDLVQNPLLEMTRLSYQDNQVLLENMLVEKLGREQDLLVFLEVHLVYLGLGGRCTRLVGLSKIRSLLFFLS